MSWLCGCKLFSRRRRSKAKSRDKTPPNEATAQAERDKDAAQTSDPSENQETTLGTTIPRQNEDETGKSPRDITLPSSPDAPSDPSTINVKFLGEPNLPANDEHVHAAVRDTMYFTSEDDADGEDRSSTPEDSASKGKHPETQDNRAYSNTTDLPARDSAEKAKAGPISAGGSPAPPHPEPHINLPATDSSKHSSPQFSLVTPLPARDDAHAAQPESRPSDDSATKNPSMLDTITLPNSVDAPLTSMTVESDLPSPSFEKGHNEIKLLNEQIRRESLVMGPMFSDPIHLDSQSVLDSASDLPDPVELARQADYCLELYLKYFRTDHLNEAIAHLHDVVSLVPGGHPDRGTYLGSLGIVLALRFQQIGETDDFTDAISTLKEALSLTPEDDAERSSYYSSIGTSYHQQFQYHGRIEDLEEAIAAQRSALAAVAHGDAEEASYFCDLGASLYQRFTHSGQRWDLEESISLEREGLHLLSEDDPDRPVTLRSLGVSLYRRSELDGKAEDLEEAIELERQALDEIPEDDPDRATYFRSLGDSLHRRFQLVADEEDLDAALLLFEEAVRAVPDGHPDQCPCLDRLARTLVSRSDLSVANGGNEKDLDQALSHWSAAVSLTSARLADRLDAAREWASAAQLRKRDDSALQACEAAIQLLPRLATVALTAQSRLRQLESTSLAVASDAAAYAIDLGQFEKAVELLDAARSAFWMRTLHLRTPLDDLRAVKCELADEIEAIGGDLEAGSKRPIAVYGNTASRPDRTLASAATLFRTLGEKWESLANHARDVPGFKRFLKPAPFEDLRQAGADGPIVIVNASTYGCDSLILLPNGSVAHVPFAELDLSDVTALAERLTHAASTFDASSDAASFDNVLRSVLDELWVKVVGPIFTELASLAPRPERIWWYPTGPFSYLPLHAASAGRSTDFTPIASYTPTIAALINGKRNKLFKSIPFHLLAIGSSSAPSKDGIGFVVSQTTGHGLPHTVLVDSSATIKNLRSLLSSNKHSHLHFACANTQDQDDPLAHAFEMNDGRLRLDDIAGLQLDNFAFAYLAMCCTATGKPTIPDEIMRLPASLQLMGIRGTVGTMWRVSEKCARDATIAFYEQPLAGDAATMLDKTVRALQAQGTPLHEWVSFIHTGV